MQHSTFRKLKTKAIIWFEKFLPDCRNTSLLASISVDENLPLRQKVLMKLHLAVCSSCRNYLSNLKFMRQVIDEGDPAVDSDPGISLDSEARERIKSVLSKSASSSKLE